MKIFIVISTWLEIHPLTSALKYLFIHSVYTALKNKTRKERKKIISKVNKKESKNK